jgi:hypothetical protein
MNSTHTTAHTNTNSIEQKIEEWDILLHIHPPMKDICDIEIQLQNSIQMQVIQNYDPDIFVHVDDPVLAAAVPLEFEELSAVLSRIQNPIQLELEIRRTQIFMISLEYPQTRKDLGPVLTKLATVRLTQLFRALLSMRIDRKW